MNQKMRGIINRVVKAASNTPHFFDFNERERMEWLITQAFILGQLSAARAAYRQRRQQKRRDGLAEDDES